MSGGWGHTIQPLASTEYASGSRVCAGGLCTETSRWLATYKYVTGRAGRVSWARRFYCDAHAEKFRAKHHPLEVEGPEPRHALERLTFTFDLEVRRLRVMFHDGGVIDIVSRCTDSRLNDFAFKMYYGSKAGGSKGPERIVGITDLGPEP